MTTHHRFVSLSLALATLCLVLAKAEAQPLNSSTVEDMVATADEQLELHRPYNALEWYKKAYDEEKSPELAFRIAELNFELRDYRKAVSYFQRAMRKAADGEMVEGLYYMGVAHKMEGNYGEAVEALKEFMQMDPGHELVDRAKLEIAGAQMALKMTEPPRIKVENAGRQVNTSNQEYSPSMAPDGSLYYAGFGKSGYVKEEGEDARSISIYKSAASESGEYGKGKALPKAINRGGFQTSNVAIGPSGATMLFVRTVLEGAEEVQADIYYAAQQSGNRWGGAEPVENVNGDYLAKHPAFGELFGKEVMFFASDMEGGQGGLDLYYATKLGEGQYDRPVNLGEAVNTPYDDVTPFYKDGTLYFSSNGYPTLGGFDVFSTEWSGDSWSAPANMGKGFNSSYDDRYFQLDETGKNGVLTSNRPPTRSVKSKTCCDDVFLLNVEPIIVQLLTTTLDEDGQLLNEVTIDLASVSDGDTTVLSRKLNPKGNRFDFELVDGQNYVLLASRDGYLPTSTEFNTVGVTEPGEMSKTLVLTRKPEEVVASTGDDEETIELTLNQPIRLANIYYDFDDDKILPDAEPDLQYILDLMQQYPEMVVELGSHTDARGKDSYNQVLSQRRAQSAVDWIAARGIDRARLRARGYGEEVILNQCENGVRCDDDEHRFNRRTEFRILEGPTSIQVKKLTKTRKVPDRGALPTVQDTTPPTGFTIQRGEQRIVVGDGGEEVRSAKKLSLKEQLTERYTENKFNGFIKDDLSSLYYEKDLTGVPLLEFEERRVSFGEVKKGDKREHRYVFKNVGNVPASIGIVSACSCTTLDWTKGEITPGEYGYVNAVFDSSEKDAGELIVIDIILDQEAPSGNGIIERVQYDFELVE